MGGRWLLCLLFSLVSQLCAANSSAHLWVNADTRIDMQALAQTCAALGAAVSTDPSQSVRVDTGIEFDKAEKSEQEPPYAGIEDQCSAFAAQLQMLPMAKVLADSAPQTMPPQMLGRLLEWQREYIAAGAGPRMDAKALAGILADLPVRKNDVTLWDRLKLWLKERFQGSDSGVPSWLQDFSVPKNLLDWIFFLSCLIVVGGALAIVGNEFYQFYRSRQPTATDNSGGVVVNPLLVRTLRFSQLKDMPVTQQPGHLLKIALQYLDDAGLLARKVSLTHRDIAGVARRESSQSVVKISSAAERATYGDWQPSQEDIHELVEITRSLLASPAKEKPTRIKAIDDK